ncbi:MAG: DNA cytosine methyltransferase [Desulfovibrio sp.]|jgi:DNA (cytosine-5)-methyltransferase 1|nr:DNA cytosine methyltransferase [Desulfovibrio sp.]
MAYKLLDLFSGCGGMTLGFCDPHFGGGFESVFAVDHDKAATAPHVRRIWGNSPENGERILGLTGSRI